MWHNRLVLQAGYGGDGLMFALPWFADVVLRLALGYMMQPVVIEAVTSVVTVRVRRATRIVVVETVGVSPAGNGSIATNGTANAGKVTALGGVFSTAASFGFGSHAPLYSATGR